MGMLNGLRGLGSPWHILITFEQFDEDGDNVHSGTFEKFWAGTKKYKSVYKTDDLSQTDYATDQGLFRAGDMKWPTRAQVLVEREILDPFNYATTLHDVKIKNARETFGSHTLDCAEVRSGPAKILSSIRYCFNGAQLRYSQGSGWNQTTYNDVTPFTNRMVARSVDVYNGGHPYLKLRVQRLESISDLDDALFTPPPDAINLLGQRLTGVEMVVLKPANPEWPGSISQDHFSVIVDLVVGKDGHVLSAHPTSGPVKAYKAAQEAALHFLFAPYLLLGVPMEVSMSLILSNN